MAVISYPYQPRPQIDQKTKKIREVYYPFIPVMICYVHKLYPYAIDSLVDSGSDTNLFPAQFGEKVGIKVRKGKSKKIYGIGKKEITGFTHSVKLYLGTKSYNTTIDFAYGQQCPLLGRKGFFDFFKSVNFREKEKILELIE